MSALKQLRAAKGRDDLAALLGYSPSSLSYIVYKIAPAAKYTTFTIAKKGGGSRKIDAPIPKLKTLQRKLANILYECLEEIETADGRKNRLSHAFRPDQSIITNARAHRASRFVLNLDLEDFFATLNFGRVRGFFMKNKNFLLAEPVATVIAQIACHEGKLPQGSPCSPILSELLTHFLDMRLIRIARRNGCTYTRYADDLTFSSNQRTFPAALAVSDGKGWKLANELTSRIADAGFVINVSKTRMQLRASRQTVTGLTVNRKVNVPQYNYKLARAMTHAFLSTGKFTLDGTIDTSVRRLEGLINYIYNIRERQIDIGIEAEKNQERLEKLRKQRAAHKNEHPSAIRKVYYGLVFFKNFVNPSRPVVICEGPSDVVYLKCAIRKNVAAFPKLGSTIGGNPTLNITLFKYSKQSRDLLQLRGGTPDLKFFIEAWKVKFEKYGYRPAEHPVIVLIDNDDGAKEIFKLLKGKFGITIDFATTLPFYHIHGPLYLVKTPEIGSSHKSCPEDLFDAATLATLLEGKSFNPNKEHDAPGEYGKVAFAEKVIRPNAGAIDFKGFDPLLYRISAAIDDYALRLAAIPPPIVSSASAAHKS